MASMPTNTDSVMNTFQNTHGGWCYTNKNKVTSAVATNALADTISRHIVANKTTVVNINPPIPIAVSYTHLTLPTIYSV